MQFTPGVDTWPCCRQMNFPPMQRAFVAAYVESGGRNQEKCALAAGVAPSGARAWSYKALRNPKVLSALRQIADTTIRANVVNATEVLLQVMNDAGVAPGERRKAASEVLDRAGLIVARIDKLTVDVTVRQEESRETMMWDLGNLARRRGQDPTELLGNALDFVPANFLLGPRPQPLIEHDADDAVAVDDAGPTFLVDEPAPVVYPDPWK